MDEPTSHEEQSKSAAPASQPPAARAGSPWLAGERLFALFLIMTVLGFIGTLIGFMPLVVLAMLVPVLAAAIA